MDLDGRDKADFNMAVSYLNRINILFSACDQASISLDIYAWFHSLLATYRELSTWMTDKEIIAFDDDILKINPMISYAYKKIGRTGQTEIPQDLYMSLHKMELKLRQVTKKSGLLMKMADDAFDALK